jgi:pyrroloquinoline quinone biosynthesis protein D
VNATFLAQLRGSRPRLSTKARLQVDKVSGAPVLLYPEGVVLLNTTGEAILRLCDGTRLFAEVLAALAIAYSTPAGELENDVSTYLFKLHQQSLLELLQREEECIEP